MGILSRLGIRFDSHTLGNVLKNVSPAAAFVPGIGLAGTAALSAAGDLARGKNIGQAAIGAAKNTALAAGARGVAGHFGALGQGEASAAPATTTYSQAPDGSYINAASGAPVHSSIVSGAGEASGDIGGAATPAAVAPTVATPGSSSPGLFSRLASGALDHDKLTSNALSAAGSLVGSGARNRQTDAQTRLLDLEAEQRQQDLERQKQSAQLDPLRAGIYKQIFSNLGTPQPAVTG